MNVLEKLKQIYKESFLLEYIDKCKNGEIIVGRELMLQLDMLIDHFSDNNIEIDFTAAHKRIKFIQERCKHAEAPHAGKPFILMLFQKAFIESIYSFYIIDEDTQEKVSKYQDVMFLVSRKNGKTPLISALCLAEFFVGETGTKILCSSNDYTQADLAFQSINNMREQSPALAKVTRKNIKGIYFGNIRNANKKGKFSYANKGNITKISAKSQGRDGKNIRVGLFDEVHQLENDDPIMPIRQALSTQLNPLYFELTTNGMVDGGYLDTRLAEARKVLNGELSRPRWLIWLFTHDSESEIWRDEESWYKSNPGLGVIKKKSFLRQLVEESKTNTATRIHTLCKDFNEKQNSAAAWLTEADINNPATFIPEKFKGKYYIGSLDFAETTDLCSAKALFYDPETGGTFTLSMYFICENKADSILDDDDKNPEKKNYREWERQGLVTICKGDEVDPLAIVKWYYGLYENYKMLPFKQGFDNWHATGFKNLYTEHFGEGILERIGMDYSSLSNPMRLLESALKNKTHNYNNNPIDRWNLKNVSIKMDNIGRIMPIKLQGRSKNRIDGALGFIIAFATYSRFKSEYMARC